MLAAALALVLQAGPPELDRLIRDLGHDDPVERDRAVRALIVAGPAALPALRRAADSADLEVSSRARRAIRRIELERRLAEFNPPLSPELLEVVPEIVEPLVRGTEADLLLVVALTRGIGEGPSYLGTAATVEPPLLVPVFRVIWDRLAAAREAGAPMTRLEPVFLMALYWRSERASGASGGSNVQINAVPSDRLLEVYGTVEQGFNHSVLEQLLTQHPPFGSRDRIRTMLEQPNPQIRRLGAKLAGRIGDRASIPKLREMLVPEQPVAAAGAVESLGRLGDRASIGPIAALLGSSRRELWNAACAALVELEAYDKVPEMIEAIEGADVYNRGTLVQGLVNLRAEAVAPCLEDWLQGNDDSWARSPMLQGLALLEPPGYAETLDEQIEQLDGWARYSLAESLGLRGDVARMVKLLEGTEGWYRANLLERLAAAGAPGADEAILKALEDSPDTDVVALVGRRKLEAAAPKLEELSGGGGDVELIRASIRALGALQSDAFDRRAAGWFGAEDKSVGAAVLEAAAERGTCGAITRDQIVARLEEKETRAAAMGALAAVWKAEAGALLASRLTDADAQVRLEAALALARADEAAAAARMRQLVKEAKPEVRRGAALWLAERLDPAAVPALKTDLEERTAHGFLAAQWLARLHDPAAGLELYRGLLAGQGVSFYFNALAQPKAWDRLAAMPIPAGAPVWPTLSELADWLGRHGVPVRWDPSVRPSFRRDHVATGGRNVLELLERIHGVSRGSQVRLEADGTVVLQSTLTARQGWFDWWEKQHP
jgi:HEAT repeat protein